MVTTMDRKHLLDDLRRMEDMLCAMNFDTDLPQDMINYALLKAVYDILYRIIQNIDRYAPNKMRKEVKGDPDYDFEETDKDIL